ncbi:hypothetical protein HYDPIDRAFT_113488 [Hydnomerulius pinastri MD-312]|uniref:Uncharacterized protein n=1 Tax=Hydnomerulius pinastri MD-312 TaxID=994086 RepID=A0A0C9WDY4_9AGAM|nr:hypothetical protein HYDPIDRAFT_113488 [Hydnomerulius pinastri MD-312]
MQPDVKSWFESLKFVCKLILSQGAYCFRSILASIRRLLSLRPFCRRDGHFHLQGFIGSRISSSSRRPPILSSSGSASLPVSDPSKGYHILPSIAASPPSPPNSPPAGHSYPPAVAPPVPASPPNNPSRALSPAISTSHKVKKRYQPFAPEEIQRYDRPVRINRKARTGAIQPFKLDFDVHNGYEWKRCTHPEGSLYFYLEHDGRRTVTDSNIDDPRIRNLANTSVASLWRKIDVAKYSNAELVIEILYDENYETCKYYFVSHDALLLFWLQEFIPDVLFSGVKGVEANDHIGLAIEAQYWFHCELFPNHIPINKVAVGDLRAILLHATSDAILSDNSLVPFSVTELQQLLDLVTNIGDAGRQTDGCITSVIGRLMRIFTRLKFVNFHGQAGARLNADQSLYGKRGEQTDKPTSHFVRFLDPILFNAPSAHVKQLHRLWVDHTINVLRWRSFIGTLFNEWNGFTIYSTVLLAVDVSFLAVPEMNGNNTVQMVAQVAIYLSTLSSVGSLVASVLLTDQSRGQGMQSAEQAAHYMLQMAKSSVGLDTLGIMYSLPFGLIMWGMIFFIIALSVMVFGQGGIAPRAVVIPFFVVIATLASWPAWYKGEGMFFWLNLLGKNWRRPRAARTTPLP